jgi:dihydroflavonol-4-reductase
MANAKYSKVFIVGGTGFLGWHAANEFQRRGYQVTVLSLPPLPAKDLFPPEVKITLADLNTLSDEEIQELLNGQDALIFAAGVDDRNISRKPAYPYFYRGNVQGPERVFRLARQAGVKRGLVLSSYFIHFANLWPQYRLAERHPYIRSRIEQMKACIAAGDPSMDVMILGLPYIFGSMPGRMPLWSPLVDYIRASRTLFYTRGGSACVSVKTVAEAIVAAIENGQGGEYYLIGDENLGWEEMLQGLADAMGLRRKVITLPNWVVKPGVFFLKLVHSIQGKEGGLDPMHLLDLQANETFFDPESARQALGFQHGDLKQAFADTVAACPEKR